MSISTMLLSSDIKSRGFHAKDYNALAELTKEGLFLNKISKENHTDAIDNFFASLAVYPTNKLTVIREFFGGL